MINTEIDFELINKQKVKLTLNFKLLLKLKANYPEEYNNFNKYILNDGGKNLDFFEILTVIYVAYLCANLESKNKYTKEEFIKLVPFNINLIKETQNTLLGLKKN